MTSQPDPGWMLPNRFVRELLLGFGRLLGVNGLVAVLKLSGLSDWGGSPPADDLQPGVRFSDVTALYRGLESIYGERGARGLIRQANHDAFKQMWLNSGGFTELIDAAPEAYHPGIEGHAGWERLAKVFGDISDLDFDVHSEGNVIQLHLFHCPDCLGHRTQEACCTGMLGWLEAAYAVLHPGTTARIEETECQAAGAMACTFIITSPEKA